MGFKTWIKKLTGNLTLDDLPQKIPSVKEMRKNAEILIIDDDPLTYEDALRANNFKFQHNWSWNTVNDVKDYQIIITDNKGVVNQSFGEDCTGITMAIEAKKLYPEKKIVVYSGNLIDARKNDISNFDILTRGSSFEDWRDMLDDAVRDSYNPKLAWRIIAEILDKNDISEKEKRNIQHQYVKAILAKNENKISSSSWTIDKDTVSLIVRIAGLGVSTMRLISALG